MIVVLFSTTPREGIDVEAYRRTSAMMRELVAAMPGFISYTTFTADSGEGTTVVRFESNEALEAWRTHPEHQQAQAMGRLRAASSIGSRCARRCVSTGSWRMTTCPTWRRRSRRDR